jgi:hypothetical protein
MAALRDTETLVNDYWLKKHSKIDYSNPEYRELCAWANAKAYNSRKPVTTEMLAKHVDGDKTPGKPAVKSKILPLPKALSVTRRNFLKDSLTNMYPLFGKAGGRGKVKKEDTEAYEHLKEWIEVQVSDEQYYAIHPTPCHSPNTWFIAHHR